MRFYLSRYISHLVRTCSPRKSVASFDDNYITEKRGSRDHRRRGDLSASLCRTDAGHVRVPFQMLIGVNRRHSLQGYTEAAGCRSSVKRIEASVAAAVATASRRRWGIRRGGGKGSGAERWEREIERVGEAGGEAKWSLEAVALM